MFAGGTNITDIFRPGKLIQIGPTTISSGGPVSNTGFPMRRLGIDVKFMGKCGDDIFGSALIRAIEAEAPGSSKGMQTVSGENTSYTIVISPPGIDRMFLHCPGANDTFVADDVDLEAIRKTSLFHFGYPPLMAKMYADNGAELVKMYAAIKQAGATTSLDMAYPDPDSPAGQVDWASLCRKTLPHVDIFTPSVEELTFMLRRAKFQELLAAAGTGEMLAHIDSELLDDLAEQCLSAGAGIVLIKCGYLGLYIRTNGRGRLEKFGRALCGDLDNWANRHLFEPSYAAKTFVSATGAGDCTIAGFLAAFLRGCSIEQALRYACAVGAQNLSAPDAFSGVTDWQQTTSWIASRPTKNEVEIPLPTWRWQAEQNHYTGSRDGAV